MINFSIDKAEKSQSAFFFGTEEVLLFSIKFKTSNFDPPIDQMTKIRLEI